MTYAERSRYRRAARVARLATVGIGAFAFGFSLTSWPSGHRLALVLATAAIVCGLWASDLRKRADRNLW